jgi:acetoin utilization protein AcuB
MRTDLPNEMLVKAWMSAPEFTIAPDAGIEDAFSLMQRENVRHLLVMKGDELHGVVTDRDLRRPNQGDGELMSTRELHQLSEELRIYDVMSPKVIGVRPEDTTAHAARIMVTSKINCLPVIRDERVVGILTSSDLLAALLYAVEPVMEDLEYDELESA